MVQSSNGDLQASKGRGLHVAASQDWQFTKSQLSHQTCRLARRLFPPGCAASCLVRFRPSEMWQAAASPCALQGSLMIISRLLIAFLLLQVSASVLTIVGGTFIAGVGDIRFDMTAYGLAFMSCVLQVRALKTPIQFSHSFQSAGALQSGRRVLSPSGASELPSAELYLSLLRRELCHSTRSIYCKVPSVHHSCPELLSWLKP